MATLQEVELGVLGTLQVRQYGLPVPIPGAKPRAILTMLGLHGGSAVSATALAELVWGSGPPRTADKALQTHISALRRALGDGFVLTEGAGWTVNATEIDASRYKAAAKLGRDAAAAGDTSGALARFDEALKLWRGTPELPDSPRGAAERTRWIEDHACVVEDRADALLATGRAAEIIGELEAAIADAPLRERRWGHLMLALYRAGRQGEALGAFQRARSLLADELGVDPGPDLRRLEAAVVAQDDALELPVSQSLSVVTRAVTFLLTDIEGSTAAWEADADAMAAALARHDEIIEQVVTSRGGRLVKTRGEGDATFSVFDRPSAAAAAAIELREAIRHEPWAPAEPIRIRVALHTGEVELRDGDYFGRAVNRAARLRSLAAGGQILCSGATAELVIDTLADDVVLADLGMRTLKNLARPEHVFELRLDTGDDADSPTHPPLVRPELPTGLAGPGPFVGRGRELEQLLAAWQTTLTAGAHAALISGEPGVGKTRLAGEWSRRAYEQGAVVLYGRCDEDLGAPYQPFAEALRSLVPCLGTDRLRGLRGVEALLPLVPGLTEVLPDLAAPPRADPDTERYALFDAVVAVLDITSTDTPVVLILDDLHWAAKPTLLLLRHLLRFGEQARVQIVGTYRSTDLDRSHPLAAMLADLHRDGSAFRLALGGLDADEVTAYVAESGYDDEELARALASVTGGNPFFLIEALRHVRESGGRWDPSTLPQGVREAVSRRLSRLPVETNKALAAAAVVGSRFALELVEQVVGTELVDAFDEASQAGILIEEPGGRYRFNHALVRQSLLAELASVRRMRLHQRIAAALETEPGADDELLAELAYHYFECAWAGNAAKAVDYCRRAADQAMARLAYEGAAEFYDRALHALEELDDDLPDRDELQAELLIARCEALLTAGDVTSATGAVAQLRQAAGDSARLVAWGTCFDGELSMLTNPERLDEIAAATGAAADSLAGLHDTAGEAKAHTVRAYCLGRLGRVGDCETALDQALTAARRAGDHRRVNAVLAVAPLAALWGPNPVPRAGGRCLDVVRLLRITTGSPVVEATSTRCQAVLDAFRGRASAGRQSIDSARRSLTELGVRHALLEVDQFAGIIELVADDPASAETHLRRAYNGFRRMGLDADTAETAALLARACLALDRDTEADELCSESECLAGDALKAAIAWRTVRAQLLSRRGVHDEARQVAEDAVALAVRTDALVDHGDACLALAMVLGAAGDDAGEQAAAERAIGLYELKGAAALVEKARRMLGERAQSVVATAPEIPAEDLDNACAHVVGRLFAAVGDKAWDEAEKLYAPLGSIESRRKIVGFTWVDYRPGEFVDEIRRWVREMGAARHHHAIIAVRGERLALVRMEAGTEDRSPGAPQDEMLQLFGLDATGRIALQAWFDIEDMEAALAELDAMHVRFEQERILAPVVEPENACVRMLRRMEEVVGREDWDEFFQMYAPDVFVESRRKIVGFTLTDLPSSDWPRQAKRLLEAGGTFRLAPIAVRGERSALFRLDIATADASPGAPNEETLLLTGLDGEGRVALQVSFDIDDLDAALAELDEQQTRFEVRPPRAPLENAASRADHKFNALFAERRWDEIALLISEDTKVEDRRRGLRREVSTDRATSLAEVQAVAELGVTTLTSAVIAIRGDHLALLRTRYAGRDQRPDAFHTEALRIAEIDADGQVVRNVAFDLDDLDSAFAELEARYLAGEAAPYAQTWSVIAAINTGTNRGDHFPTTPDWVNIDHRRGTAFAPGDMQEYMRASWEQTPALKIYVETVHRLSSFGAVVTAVAEGSSREGFEAEWRTATVVTVDDQLVSRCEMFDDTDLDAAIARFDELQTQSHRVENAATRVYDRYLACFAARDWDAIAGMVAEDHRSDDRRRVVNEGIRHGRDAEVASWKSAASAGVTGFTDVVIATRGDHLALYRIEGTTNEGLSLEVLRIVEINADERIVARVMFDLDDIDAAFTELDTRYSAGEAAAHARVWSVIAQTFAAFNRLEADPTTPDWVYVDNRRLLSFETGDPTAFARAIWDVTPDIKSRIETVHRLNDLGAVVTNTHYGTSHDGFDAEWRMIAVITVDGDLFTRCEVCDETDLDAALTRFDELNRPAPRLENTASQVAQRFTATFAARDWSAMAELLAKDMCNDDRRRVVNAGVRHGRDLHIADCRAAAELGAEKMAFHAIATRGEHLALHRVGVSNRFGELTAEIFGILEIDAENRISAIVLLDLDDLDAAFAELDARYLAGEAAAYVRTWSAQVRAYSAVNRHELPEWSSDWVNIDHRKSISFETDDMAAYVQATFDEMPVLKIYIEAVHRLSNVGTVVTHIVRGTSQRGFEAEWREVALGTVDGGLINRAELYDESDLDAALARFDELSRPVRRLENTASRMYQRYNEYFAAHDWNAMAEMVSDDICSDDRRRVVNSGIQRGRDSLTANMRAIADIGVKNNEWSVIATRGERLALIRSRVAGGRRPDAFNLEMVTVSEVDAAKRFTAGITFDLDDIDAAFEELDTRYAAGEAALHGDVWSVIAGIYDKFNCHELPATTPDLVTIDHRPLITVGPGDMAATIRAVVDELPNLVIRIETVHRLTDLGAVITHVAHGVSRQGFDAQWRMIFLYAVQGDLVSRYELFDESDLDTALARFDELSAPAPRLENAATRRSARIADAFNRRDLDGFLGAVTVNAHYEDRRKGLRDEGAVNAELVQETLSLAEPSWQLTIDPIAVRGHHLALSRYIFRDAAEAERPIVVEALVLTEVTDGQMDRTVAFDPDDTDAAFAELDARYAAGEAAGHAHTWSVMARNIAAYNGRELPGWTPDNVHIDHRQAISFGPGDLPAYIQATWDQVPDTRMYIEAVHRLSHLGAVVTHVTHGTSREGFTAEWRGVSMVLIDGELTKTSELFEDSDLDAALARFDALDSSAP